MRKQSARGDYGAPMNKLFVVVFLAGWWVVAVGSAWGGTIKGSVRYMGAAMEKKKVPVTIDQYVCGKDKDGEDLVLSSTNGIRNAVVSLQNLPAGTKAEPSPPSAKMDQHQCTFVPRVVVVPVGGTVEFMNSDRLLHNVRNVGKENPPFNRAQPHARNISIVFKKPEILRIDCDLHSWMRAWVVVAEHPFYSVTNDQGDFILDNVPAGKYTLQVWQEALGTAMQEVTVADKGITTVNFGMQKK